VGQHADRTRHDRGNCVHGVRPGHEHVGLPSTPACRFVHMYTIAGIKYL
jgi:hypothetical protein